MFKSRLFTLWAMIAAFAAGISAQVVTYSPDPLYDNSENVVIYFHANMGNKKLAGLPETTAVYAHCGLITASSKDDTDWKYDTKWGDNAAQYKMTYVAPNEYKLVIGDIKTFFGVKSANEVIKDLAFVFRTSDGKKEGKDTGDKNILVPVISTALQMNFSMTPDALTYSSADPTIHISFTSNQKADRIWIAINGIAVAEATNAQSIECDYTFTEVGSYNVYGNLTINGKNSSQGRRVMFVDPGEQKNYPGGTPKMGARRDADGNVLFCLAAPQKMSVKLVGSWNDYSKTDAQNMYYQDYEGQRYFWTSVSGLDDTSMYLYYYSIDEGAYNVGDPYAKLILDPANDKYIPASVYPNLPEYPTGKVPSQVSLAVYQENINDYEWTDDDFVAPDQTDLVIYEMLFRDFTGTEGKALGNGTVNLAIEKLPYLKELGINAVELLPINEFNGNISWGYNPNFYFAPDKAYGTPDDYKNFINACHENGIAVILDLVFNQTDWQHPWYRMYPVGSNPMYNPDAPHAYSVLNDINQGHPLIRQQWKDVVKYWLEEYHVDGYRFDLVKGLGDNNSYANSGSSATEAYNSSRVANMRAIQEAMNEVKPGAYFINENLAGAKEENEMAQTGMLNWANVNHSGTQYAKGISTDNSLLRMNAAKDGGRTWGSTVAYLESHDEQRLAYAQKTSGVAAIKNDHAAACRRLGSAAAQMILVPGAHMIWQFSEMGNDQSTKNGDGGNNVDPKKVNWNLLNDPDNKALMQNYAELIKIRLSNPDLFAKDATYTSTCASTTSRYIKAVAGNKELICAINPKVAEETVIKVAFNSPNNADYAVASLSRGTSARFNAAEGTVTVAPNSYVLLVNNNVSAVDNITSDSTDNDPMVYSADGTLFIGNAAAGIHVYDVQGVCHYSNPTATEAVLNLPAGLYIVRTGQKAVKTIVR